MQDTRLYQQILGLSEPWVVTGVDLKVEQQEVCITVEHQPEATWTCPECGRACGLYDHAPVRAWRHLDTCQFQTYLLARIPRIDCPEHGIRNVAVPWAEPGGRFTLLMERLLIDLLQQCQNLLGVCRLARISWDQALGVLQRAVARGQARQQAKPIKVLGVDEKAFRKGHHYVTVVSDLEAGAVVYVAEHRSKEALAGFYQSRLPSHLEALEAVAMDLSEAYRQATLEHVPRAAEKIVFDRFHIMKLMNGALDRVRQQEHVQLSRQQDPRLARTRSLWLWAEEHLPEKHRSRFDQLKSQDLQTAKAWAIKENLRHLWAQPTLAEAQAFFDQWHQWVLRVGLKPVMHVARTLQARLAGILNYVRHPITSAGCEGLNSKIGSVKTRAAGFRNLANFKQAILFYCGKLDLYP